MVGTSAERAVADPGRGHQGPFPNGLPASDGEKSDLTEWTKDQEQRLSALADEFTEFNGRIINILAAFYRKNRAG